VIDDFAPAILGEVDQAADRKIERAPTRSLDMPFHIVESVRGGESNSSVGRKSSGVIGQFGGGKGGEGKVCISS
jgi:hypothetical protein